MTTYSIFEQLLELNQESAKELIRTYFKTDRKETFLIFPKKRNGEIRISEQELRFTMVNFANKYNYQKLDYAIEVPTNSEYSFNGIKKRSGSTDLAFYSGDEKVLNVEFKANNPMQEAFDKDIEKLFIENCHGAWCHILRNEDSGSLRSVISKIKNAVKLIKYSPNKPLYFSFLILETKRLLSRKGVDGEEKQFNIDKILNIKYEDYSRLNKGKHQIGDWQVDQY
jgi:hypothetical protein